MRANRTGATLVIVRRLLVVLLPLTLVGATPAPASPDQASVTVVELARGPSRSIATAAEGTRFTLVGVHWRGPGHVLFRTRSLSGTWTAWRPAAPEDEDAPNPGSAEARGRAGWHLGNPWWVGASDRIDVRRVGRVGRVRAYLVWSPPTQVPLRRPAATSEPTIVPRSAWGADESIRRAQPSYAPRIRFAVVHHTAGRNAYTQAEAPAIVKGIQLYHVRGNGWNDIGYNYLVDRFGTVYEGRYGGIDKAVVGAHARGFNTGSAGIALLGTYSGQAPTKAAQGALTSLIAWRLDVAHVDPLSMQNVISSGSERWAAKVPVLLRAVSGHRDTGFTECPGGTLYSRLNQIAADAAKLGGPKIFDPRVEASAEGPVRFRARLSQALPWTVTVTSAGAEVARGTGSGKTLDWTWDATSLQPGSYRWSISAGSARPATGSVKAGLGTGTGTTLAISEAAATPGGITPNGDGQGDVAEVSFSLSVPANVTVEVADSAGTVLATVGRPRVAERRETHRHGGRRGVRGRRLHGHRQGTHAVGRRGCADDAARREPSARPRLGEPGRVLAERRRPQRRARDRVRADRPCHGHGADRARRQVGGLARARCELPAGRAPDHLGRLEERRASARRDVRGHRGGYGRDGNGELRRALRVRHDGAARPDRARLKVRLVVSEPATVAVTIGSRRFQRQLMRPGTLVVGLPRPGTRVRVVATDAAGNASPPAVWRRPARKG